MSTSKEKLKIEWKSDRNSLNQIYSNGTEVCFITKDNEQATDLFFCKDYMHDIIRGALHNESIDVYGLKFKPNQKEQIDLEQTRICISNKSYKNYKKNARGMADFMNQIESEFNLKRTKVYEVQNDLSTYEDAGMLVFEGSSRWLISPPMISLYVLLLRCSHAHKNKNAWRRTVSDILNEKIKNPSYQSNDKNYLEIVKDTLEKIIQKGYANIFYKDIKKNYPSNIDITTFHNRFGICSFAEEKVKSTMGDWYKNL